MLSYLKNLIFGEEGLNEELARNVLTKLNKDVARQILMELDEDEDVLKICDFEESISKNICDNAFFYNRLAKKYPKLVNFKPDDLGWKKYYLRVIYYIAKLEEDFEFEFTEKSKSDPKLYDDILRRYGSEAGLEKAAFSGLKDLAEYYIKSDEEIDTRDAFISAIEGNDKATIFYFLSLSPEEKDWDTALYKSAANKNKELINLFLKKGANINDGLKGAAQSGDMSLIKFFIDKGANDWNGAMTSAALGENREIVAFFIDKAEKEGIPINWGSALDNAARAGNLNLVKFFYKQGEFNPIDLGNVVHSSLRGPRSKEIVKYLISKGFKNWDLGYHYAKVYGNNEMMIFFFDKKNE